MQTATVVIPNFNGMRFLKDCLDSLMEQSRQDFSIVLIDNGSTDGSAEYVESHYPEVQVCRNQKNLGFCRAVNQGIRLEKDGYDPATRDVTVTAGNELEVALNLDSNTGGIDLVTVPSYITIYLDGKMVGTSEPDPANPGMSKLLSLRNLSMGKHVVTIAHKRARPEKRSFSVEIKKGEVKRLPNLTLWIPNVKLTLKSGLTRVGRLASNLKEEIMFEPEPGVKQSYKKAAISDIEYLKANE